jgi:hypothetical protein
MPRKLPAFPGLNVLFVCFFLAASETSAQSSAPASPQFSNIAPLITQAVDDSNLVVLRGNTHPLARPEYDQGPAPANLPMQRMLLVLKRSPTQEAALEQLLQEQQDNSSPNYHQWLTPQQFGQEFGLSDQDIQTITTWLASHGLQAINVSNGCTVIEFSGTAGQVQDAFHTSIHKYVVNGQPHYANSSDPEIPAALAPAVAGIRSLHNFPAKTMNHFAGTFQRDKQTGKLTPLRPLPIPQFYPGTNYQCGILGGSCELLGPYDLATIYNVSALWNSTTPIDGTGQTIAIVGETDINPADWTSFWNMFGVSAPTGKLNIIHNGPDPGILTDGEEAESDIDTQWSSAVAKGATIDFVVSESTETTLGVDLSAEYIVDNNLAPVMSMSYGICELFIGTSGNSYYNSLWQQASAQGISVFVSSGDQGSAVCDGGDQVAQFGLAANGFGSTPYNVSVGGTDFNDLTTISTYWNSTNNANQANAKGYIPEMTWNDSCTNQEIFPYIGVTTAEQSCNSQEGQPFVGIGGGSGGASNCISSNGQTPASCTGGYAKPVWQTGPGVPSDGKRDVPDVSFFASNGFNNSFYVICESDATGACNLNGAPISGYGGTSVSSPAFAGIMALVNQKTGQRQGNPNYVFYKMAAASGASCNSNTVPITGSNNCIFYDTPAGSTIAMPCATGSPNCSTTGPGDAYGVLTGFATTAGYDQATGLGTVNVTNLVNDWSNYAGQFKATKFSNFSLSPTTTTHGQPVTLNATVVPQTGTGTPTGTITLIANDNTSSQQAAQQVFNLNNGSVSGTTIMLPGGTNIPVTAHYSGDATFAPTDSSRFTVTINPEPSSTSGQVETYNPITGQIINSNATNIVYGTATLLRANVTNSSGNLCAPSGTQQYGCPTGSVTLSDTFNPGTGPQIVTIPGSPYSLNSEGYTEDQALFLLGGTHSIVASYSGDSSFDATGVSGSSASPDAVTVTPAITQISAYGGGPILLGNNAQITANVSAYDVTIPSPTPSNSLPSQIMQFFDGGTQISGTITYTSNYIPSSFLALMGATLNISSLSVGNHSITAQFPGDSNYAPSGSSNPVTVDVLIPTSGSLTTSSPNVTAGTPVTFNATFTPSQSFSQPMTGSVAFYTGCSGCNFIGTSTLANSQAQITSSSLPAGTYFVYADYSGDTNYGTSTASVAQTVIAINTTTSLTASSTSVQQGSSLTLTATITPAQTLSALPTGTVQFLYSNVVLGSVFVVNNQAQLATNSLPVGSDVITAKYSGDSNYASSTSSPVTVTVTGPPTFTISANPSPIVVTTPGASGSSTLTFTSMNGYANSIPLSGSLFSGLPSETTCNFNVTSVTLTASGSGSTATAIATCQTTAPSSSVAPLQFGKRPSGPVWWLPFGLAALIAGVLATALLLTNRQTPRLRPVHIAFAVLALAAVVAMSSCGGGSSGPPPPPPNPGTPVGLDSNVMITFNNAGVSPAPALNLPINVE